MKKDTSTYLLIAGGVVVVVLLMRSNVAKPAASSASTLFSSITNIINGIGRAFGPSPAKPGSAITPGAFGSGATSVPGSARSGSDFVFDDGSTLDNSSSTAGNFSGTGDDLLAPTFDV